MKNRLIYIIIVLAVVTTSCSNWLDVRPRTQISTEEMFETETGFKDAVIACYVKLNSPNLYGDKLTITHIEYLAQHWNLDQSNQKDEINFKAFNYDKMNAPDVIKSIYGELYNTISQVNTVLENIKTKGDVIKNEKVRATVEAEMLAIRAFCHFDILRLFGQLPNGGKKSVSLPYSETVSRDMVPYYSYAEFTAKIKVDLLAAEKLLENNDIVFDYSFAILDRVGEKSGNKLVIEIEDNFLGFRKFRFNYYAIKALQARVSLYIGETQAAYEAAKVVINAKAKDGLKYINLAGKDDFNKKYNALPSEFIFGLSNSELKETTQNYFQSRDYGRGAITLDKAKINDLFIGQSTSINNRYAGSWSRELNNQGIELFFTKKYVQPEEKDGITGNELATKRQVIPILRLSEMYLIAMESAPLSEANALYLEYMAARDVDAQPFTDINVLKNEIINEYRREFFGEGVMFYTYKRNATKIMLWKTDREVSENDYILPLPSSELGKK